MWWRTYVSVSPEIWVCFLRQTLKERTVSWSELIEHLPDRHDVVELFHVSTTY